MKPILVISPRDNVATALEPLESGQAICAGDVRVHVVEPVPRGHKVALIDIRAGDPVIKYGNSIGLASTPIAAGAHVHTHNVASARGRGDLQQPVLQQQPVASGFLGSPKPHGGEGGSRTSGPLEGGHHMLRLAEPDGDEAEPEPGSA